MTVRFAALGDSLTEGVGDPVPGGWRGWAALLAPALSPDPVEFRNLANSGALSRDLLVSQLPTALALRPRYAAVLIGGNDTLRSSFDLESTARRFASALSSLTAIGTLPLTACLPDPGRLLGLPAPLARPLARRMRGVNAVVHALSAHYGAAHLHLADLPWTRQRELLSVDRLHPSAAGHQLIAREFHALLAAAGHPVGTAPAHLPVTAPGPGPTCGGWPPGAPAGWRPARPTSSPACSPWPPRRPATSYGAPPATSTTPRPAPPPRSSPA
ncbi:SGNH/GDSL hydrolase family protein [Kitasatospora fiedleri]|uniref:SGNH/GDSL hydrolase family protein n=1 Tax=Kitasatospora fiedleri TaxID=2991545 RepID=UPI00249B66C8|nr:GDSL-type esterase/lipase family protein [Kitasatospora fiedleri]